MQMNKVLGNVTAIFIFFAALLPPALEASENAVMKNATYAVPANEKVTAPAGRVAMLIDQFNMGEGSSIEFSDTTSLFIVHAKHASIGNRAQILAKGRDGQFPTGAGQSGPTVILILEDVRNVSGLTVSALGGNGANGKDGAKGSKGRQARCLSWPGGGDAGNGKAGGNGTSGGNAGDGGKIFLVLPREASGYGITMVVAPGRPGIGGKGGEGGAGGRGKECCGPFCTWSKGWGSSGADGQPGNPGNPGYPGVFRTYTVDLFDRQTVSTQLEDIVSFLNENGFAEDAAALRMVVQGRTLTFD